jgi:hypothetical protein
MMNFRRSAIGKSGTVQLDRFELCAGDFARAAPEDFVTSLAED